MKRFTVLAAGLLLWAGTAHAAEKWNMPTAYGNASYHTQNAKLFAKAVNVCTGGKLDIVVHGGGSFIKGGEIKRAVQTGKAPIGERLLSAHQNENAVLGFDSVPLLATSFEASERLWRAARSRLTKILAAQNLVLLYSVPWPPQGMYFKRAIGGVADMRGIKFRAYNAATARFAALAGMPSVHIELVELDRALASGRVEAFITSSATGYYHKLWKRMSHFYDSRAWLPRNYVFAGKRAFEALDAHAQNCLRSSALLAEAAGTARARELTGFYLEQLAAGGMSVQKPGERLAADLAKIGEIMSAEWTKAAGAEGTAIIKAFRGR
ncbi:MAG: TRAP transporter substrate-binding protein [Nitrospinae bacterium]|nr:TRAP transporter substrate-binding protein [Nitrospinota bacterium]